PSWLTIGSATGTVSGTPPSGTTSFTYSVMAANGVTPSATAGPFTVTVAPPPTKSADLGVTLAAPAKATKGATITYPARVTNTGPSTATNVVLLLGAAPGVSTVSASPSPAVNLDGLLTWTLAKIDPGQSVTFTVRAKLTKADTVVATAVVASETRDTKLSNNAV